jgi:predicted aspartyl protease
MGMFKKRVRVSNSKNPKSFFDEEFWIDTGALYSFVPEDCLQRIGVEPSAPRNLVLADGRQETRLLGFCDFQIEGLEGSIPCPVIFAPKGSLFLIGATALENFGVEVDPLQKRLKPILAVIGGFLASDVPSINGDTINIKAKLIELPPG